MKIFKKHFKKTVSVVCVIALLVSAMSIAAFAAQETDYTIVNPYESVDWSSWSYYKANLHTHSTYSDGKFTLPDMVEKYYDLGYDILAMTDHGVINEGWTLDRTTYPPFDYFNHVEGHDFSIKYHTEANMTQEDYDRITTGSDRDGRGMVDVTGGIEMNMAVISKTHVNGYFTDYGSGEWGTENDYASAVEGVEKSGKGYTVLNHVGDWLDSPQHPERAHEAKNIAYFANIFVNNPSCLGMEIINNSDSVTSQDRALWDELLQVVIPTGRNIIAFADDDSEVEGDIGNSWEMFVMPENNLDNVKSAMAQGNFFCCSIYDKTDRSNITEGEKNGPVPLVSDIEVNQQDNTITLTIDSARECDSVSWTADGEVIQKDTDLSSGKVTIDLNDYEKDLGCYIRFQLNSKNGVTYSQAFELKYDGRTDKAIPEEALAKYETPLGKIYVKLVHTHLYALMYLISEKLYEKAHNL